MHLLTLTLRIKVTGMLWFLQVKIYFGGNGNRTFLVLGGYGHFDFGGNHWSHHIL